MESWPIRASRHAGAVATHVRNLDHIAIAVHDMSEAATLFVDLLGASLIAGGDNDGTGTRLMHLACGGFKLELMQPLRPDSLIAPRLEKSGPGFHHMTFVVDDLTETIDALDAVGIVAAGTDLSSPRWRETFLPPQRTFGTLLQLVDTTLRWDVPTVDYTLGDVLAGDVVWVDHIACLRHPSKLPAGRVASAEGA
jgi:methylmalonyl-CoA/ethylmalonyl-CoA epimerase